MLICLIPLKNFGGGGIEVFQTIIKNKVNLKIRYSV